MSAQTISSAIADQTGSGGTGANAGSWTLAKSGPGMLVLSAANTYSGGTTINGGTLSISATNNLGAITGGLAFNGGTLQSSASATLVRPITLNAGGGTIDTNGNNLGVAGVIAGPGGLTKNGAGVLTFISQMAYSGGTTINAGTLALTSSALPVGGAVTINGGMLSLTDTFQQVGALSGTGGIISLGSLGTLETDSAANTTLASQITGNFSQLFKRGSGTLTLTGNSTFVGDTRVFGGGLVVNGSLASPVTVSSGAMLGGTGTIGGLVSQRRHPRPRQLDRHADVNGNYVQTGGTYQVEVNNAGQSDKVNVSGAATINGGTVRCRRSRAAMRATRPTPS